MTTLHNGVANANVEGPLSRSFPRVARILRLLGTEVLLLAWPLGLKGTRKRWKNLSVEKMRHVEYLRELEAGNIGAAQGEKSNGLCSFDWDTEDWAKRFLDANPALQESLRTRGARGCNVWVQIIGDFPPSFKLRATNGEEVGEWRANGNQTIISRKHPSGCEYSFIVEASPAQIEFKNIVVPEGLRPFRQAKAKQVIAHRAHSSLSALKLSQHSQFSQVVSVQGCLFDVSSFVPTDRQQTDRLLWAMSGRMKTFEKHEGRVTTPEERRTVFDTWWPLAKENVDPSMDYWSYLTKWLGNCERRKFADDETALVAAWRAAQTEPMPAEASADYGRPMPAKMQLLVALCYQLQLYHGAAPFFLGSRDAEPLLETPYRTVAYWLEILSADNGPFRILKKVSVGSQVAQLTNEYLYVSQAANGAGEPRVKKGS
jgi:hypothetical protein